MKIFKHLLVALFMAVPVLAQIPSPNLPLTGNLGYAGAPLLNNGILPMTDASRAMTALETSAVGGFKVTGTWTADRTLTMPVGRFQFVSVGNGTTGGHNLILCSASGGLCLTIPNGQNATGVWFNGTDVTGALPVGGGGAAFPSTQGFVYNTSTSASRNATVGDFFNKISYTQGGALWGFGDSTIAGVGASGPDSTVMAYLAKDYGGNVINDGVGSTSMSFIARNLLTSLTIPDYNAITRVVIQGGINDYGGCGVTLGCENNFVLGLNAAVAYVGLPYNQRIMANQAGSVTGSWSADPILQPIAGQVGYPLSTTTLWSSLTFTVNSSTVGSVGNRIGVTYEVPAIGGGTFTFSIDGTLQTDVCSGTTTFTASGCNGVAVFRDSVLRQDFAVSGASHTVVITSTSSTLFSPISIDVAPTSIAPMTPLALVEGVIYQYLDSNSANSAAFNTLSANEVIALKAQNVNAIWVDVRGGTPGVNSTTDMSSTNPLCPGGVTPLHQNDCGYYHTAQTIENAAAAAGQPFTIPNSGGRSGVFTQPLTTAGSNSVLNDWNPNSDGGYVGGISRGITIFRNNSSGGYLARWAFALDSDSNFASQMMNTANVGWDFTTCPSNTPTSQTGCTQRAYIAPTGDEYLKGSIIVANGVQVRLPATHTVFAAYTPAAGQDFVQSEIALTGGSDWIWGVWGAGGTGRNGLFSIGDNSSPTGNDFPFSIDSLTTTDYLIANSNGGWCWSTTKSQIDPADTCMWRNSAGVVDVGNGTAGNASGAMKMANLTDSALTSGNCVQASTGGLLTTTGAACGSGSSFPVYNTSGTAQTSPHIVVGTATLSGSSVAVTLSGSAVFSSSSSFYCQDSVESFSTGTLPPITYTSGSSFTIVADATSFSGTIRYTCTGN